jgi:hypothetical protein
MALPSQSDPQIYKTSSCNLAQVAWCVLWAAGQDGPVLGFLGMTGRD